MIDNPFTIARARAMFERPYLATALSNLHPVEREGIESISGDLWWRCYYDPVWFMEIVDRDPGEAAWRLLHIVTHLIRTHGDRAARYLAQADIWGVATDEEINDDIMAVRDYSDDGRLSVPDGAIHPAMFDHDPGNLAEVYYKDLLEKCDDAMGSGGGGGGQEEDGDGEGGGKSTQEALEEMSNESMGGHGGASCGSCATGKPLDYEDGQPTGEVDESSPGVSQHRADMIRHKVAKDIQDHARQRGTMPGGWERWADGILNPRVPWQKLLQVKIRQGLSYASGMVDYTFQRPSRRQAGTDIIRPSLRRPRQKVGLIVDTSGSMSEADMAMALGTIRGVLKTVGEDGALVISCDASVHNCKKVFTEKQVRLYGGGGTDMRIPIKYFEDLPANKKPDVVVCVTDGFTPWSDKPPKGFLLITLLVDEGEAPSFGTVVRRSTRGGE